MCNPRNGLMTTFYGNISHVLNIGHIRMSIEIHIITCIYIYVYYIYTRIYSDIDMELFLE